MEQRGLAGNTNWNDPTLSWSYAYWFVFTYLPPASLVGREGVMR